MSEVTDKIDSLAAKVEAEGTVIDSAIVAFEGVAAQVKDLASQIEANSAANIEAIEKLNALGDKVDADANKLAAAIVAGT